MSQLADSEHGLGDTAYAGGHPRPDLLAPPASLRDPVSPDLDRETGGRVAAFQTLEERTQGSGPSPSRTASNLVDREPRPACLRKYKTSPPDALTCLVAEAPMHEVPPTVCRTLNTHQPNLSIRHRPTGTSNYRRAKSSSTSVGFAALAINFFAFMMNFV